MCGGALKQILNLKFYRAGTARFEIPGSATVNNKQTVERNVGSTLSGKHF